MKKKPNDVTRFELFKTVKADAENGDEKQIDATELVNKYGTYEIQPTADTQNAFPMISQGLSKDWKPDLPHAKDKNEKQ